MKKWVREFNKEGVPIDPKKLMVEKGPSRPFLPKRWIVERTIAWIDQNRRMSKDYERMCARGEAFVYECHDSPHDEAARSCLRAFHTASEEVFSEVLIRSRVVETLLRGL